jgi:hypothetical protein
MVAHPGTADTLLQVRRLHTFMKIRHLTFLGAVALFVGCASHIAKTETISGADFLLQLHQQSRLPGDSIDVHGRITCILLSSDLQQVSYPLSRTYQVIPTGGTYTNNYMIVRLTKDTAWQLQRAWQTDSQGVTEEWLVK